jgi:hypothetical protein
MVNFLIDGEVMSVTEPHVDFMVYGSFTEPTMGKNFFIVRMPAGRVPWARKIAPAITCVGRLSARSVRIGSGTLLAGA